MFQAMCRIFRLGRKGIGHAIVLAIDRAYDQTLQSGGADKMLAQMAGTGGIESTGLEREMYLESRPDCVLMSDAGVDSVIINEKCVHFDMELCG